MNAPPKKKSSTFTILLVILGGGALLFLIAVGIGVYVVMSSPEGRGIVGLMGEAVKISAKAQKAPGTKELRAMGCQQAMVMDADDFVKMASHIDAGRPQGTPPFGEMVTCNAKMWGTAPTCEDVAVRYVGAVGARKRPFMVLVQQAGKKGCSALFDEHAQRLRDLDAPQPPMPPPADE